MVTTPSLLKFFFFQVFTTQKVAGKGKCPKIHRRRPSSSLSSSMLRTSGKKRIFVDGRLLHEMTVWKGDQKKVEECFECSLCWSWLVFGECFSWDVFFAGFGCVFCFRWCFLFSWSAWGDVSHLGLWPYKERAIRFCCFRYCFTYLLRFVVLETNDTGKSVELRNQDVAHTWSTRLIVWMFNVMKCHDTNIFFGSDF